MGNIVYVNFEQHQFLLLVNGRVKHGSIFLARHTVRTPAQPFPFMAQIIRANWQMSDCHLCFLSEH